MTERRGFATLSRWTSIADRYPLLRRIAVVAVLGAALLFLIRSARSADLSPLARVDLHDGVAILSFGIAYAALLTLLARAWSLAAASADRSIGWVDAIAVYGVSTLPKYIPGSILQYGSRQVLGAARGWEAGPMARASMLEVALHVLCAGGVALALLGPKSMAGGSGAAPAYVVLTGVAVIAASFLAIVAARRLPTTVIVGDLIYQFLFFAGLAALAVACAAYWGIGAALWPQVGGLFLLSWLIGFAIPIAPGGLGVREAVGVAMLANVVGVEAALLIQASMRVVTLTGDALIFIAALGCHRAVSAEPA